MTQPFLRIFFGAAAAALILTGLTGCGVEASQKPAKLEVGSLPEASSIQPRGATIEIEPNSPADTVRAFYRNLRERKFREAIYLTNLRPAVEGLTDAELKEFQVDLEAIAAVVPAEVEINGEIVTGDTATVTARLPGEDPEKLEIQEVRLRHEAGIWVILTADGDAEKKIRQEGRNYFYNLRIETHQEEARKMLDRVSKAQMVFALQNGGVFAGIPDLVSAGLLPEDITSSESTGYNYVVKLTSDKKKYTASASPAVYGKTGKLTFTVELDDKNRPKLKSTDSGK